MATKKFFFLFFFFALQNTIIGIGYQLLYIPNICISFIGENSYWCNTITASLIQTPWDQKMITVVCTFQMKMSKGNEVELRGCGWSVNIVANQISFLLSNQFHYLGQLSYSEKKKLKLHNQHFQFSIFHFSLLCLHNHLSSFHFFEDLILLISIFNFQFHISLLCHQQSILIISFLWRIDFACQHIQFSFFISLKNWFASSDIQLFISLKNWFGSSSYSFYFLFLWRIDLPYQHIQFSLIHFFKGSEYAVIHFLKRIDLVFLISKSIIFGN